MVGVMGVHIAPLLWWHGLSPVLAGCSHVFPKNFAIVLLSHVIPGRMAPYIGCIGQ